MKVIATSQVPTRASYIHFGYTAAGLKNAFRDPLSIFLSLLFIAVAGAWLLSIFYRSRKRFVDRKKRQSAEHSPTGGDELNPGESHEAHCDK